MRFKRKVNVLSLFDGMSGTQMALYNSGIAVDKYYASEIDKYAIKITQKNFPDTIQLGDVKDIKGKDLPEIDLVVAGSPCQGFSFAGKQLAFDDERSALFFEFIRILREVKPKYFLLENVRMKKEFQDVISEQISSVYPEYTSGGLFGIEPILINSALVSAQNRQRLYWTNIPNIEQPEDLGIVLRDVLDEFPSREFYAGQELQKNYKGGNQLNPKYKSQANTLHDIDKKSPTISAGTHGYANGYISEKANEELKKMTTKDGKSYALTATYQGAVAWNSIEKKQRTMIPTYNTPKKVGMNVEEVKVRKYEVDIKGLQYLLRSMKEQSGKTNKQIATETDMPVTKVEHWFRTDTSFAIPGDDIWFKLKDILGIETDVFDKQIMEFEYRDGVYETKQRVYSENGKSPTLTSSNKEQYIETYNTPKQVGTAKEINGHDILKRVYSEDGKSPTLNSMGGGNREPKVAVKGGAIRGRYNDEGKTNQHLEVRKDAKSNAITTVQKDSVAVKEEELTWRKLTPLECERLQTFPDNYSEGVSNTQRYKMLGNGFTVRVIEHILKNMEI